MNQQRQLKSEDGEAATPTEAGAQSQLLDEQTAAAAGGNPNVDNPCVSNDNPNPYRWNCTEVPTSSPIGGGSMTDNAGDDGSSSGSGSPSGGNSGRGSSVNAGGSTADPSNTSKQEAQTAAETSVSYYTYQCTSDQYCNSYSPGNSLGLGWTLTGTCSNDDDSSSSANACPEAYDPTKAQSNHYSKGDIVMISTDDLNSVVVGSITCPSSSPNTASSSAPGQSGNNIDDDTQVLVPYVYEVETSQVSTAYVFLPRLEEQILLNLADRMMDCFVNGEVVDDGRDVVEEEEGGVRRRALLEDRDEGGGLRRRLESNVSETTDGMGYVVKGVSSNPEDVAVTEGPCTISNDKADNCFIIDGRLTVVLYNAIATATNSTPVLATTRSGSITSEAITLAVTDAAQSNLQDAMTNDDLLSPNLPEVHKVTYLGTSYESYLAAYKAEEGLLSAGGSTLPGGGGAEARGDGNGEGGGMPWLAIILGGVFGAFMVMMCALLFVRRRIANSKENKQRAAVAASRLPYSGDSQAVGGDFDWEDWDESVDSRGAPRGRRRLASKGMQDGEIVFHVNNLSSHTTQEDVRGLFEQHGIVNNCIIPQDHQGGAAGAANNGGRSPWSAKKRCALLTMPATNEAEVAEAESACHHMNGLEVDGHELEVQEVTTLYVGNLSPDTSEEDVYQLFRRYGTVTGCIIPSDHEGGNNGGGERFALVTMPTDGAAKAIKYIHGTKVHGNVVSVRDIKHMNGGRGIPGGGLAAAALAAGVMGALAAFHQGFNGGQGNDELTLHVGNMSPNTTSDDIREIFEEHGTVTQCSVPNNSRGERFALVTMPAKEAEKACNYVNGIEVDGYQLTVQHAQQVGFGQGAMSRRNLMDEDASSAYGNGYFMTKKRRDHSGKTNGEDGYGAPGVLATLGAVGTFIAAPFLLKPCRKKSKKDESLAHLESITGRSYGQSPDTDKSLDDGLDNIIRNIDGATDAHDKRNFVLDPPGAFHLGNHHYTADGVRYFSPLCEQCVAARADEDGVVALAAIHDEGEDESIEAGGRGLPGTDLSFDLEAATKFTDFNCNDLGRAHSSMHVRQCKSTTCNICQKEKGVFFVKARREL